MKKLAILTGILVLMIACNQSKNKAEDAVAATIEDLLSNPADFEGKEVAVTGMVTHVCKHGGQKCFMIGDDGETQLRINAGKDIKEFEMDIEGSMVEFRGIFRILTETESIENEIEHESKEHHYDPMPHSKAEKSSYFIEAMSYKEISD
ncbi:MAG TPA: hypothetical protein ENN61_04995 [Bacteroidaceae bacterium]|nr:hypothetical protein [Bacteroidaceae bacterium]